MRDAIDHHTARPTNSLAAVVIEGNRLAALDNEPLVHDVEHLQKGHVRTDVSRRVGDERSFRVRRRLPPHMKREIHESARSARCARGASRFMNPLARWRSREVYLKSLARLRSLLLLSLHQPLTTNHQSPITDH